MSKCFICGEKHGLIDLTFLDTKKSVKVCKDCHEKETIENNFLCNNCWCYVEEKTFKKGMCKACYNNDVAYGISKEALLTIIENTLEEYENEHMDDIYNCIKKNVSPKEAIENEDLLIELLDILRDSEYTDDEKLEEIEEYFE